MALVPFAPFQLAFLNTTATEAKFLASAQRSPKLQRNQLQHSVAALAGMAIFWWDDYHPTPYLHSLWHCVSAYGCNTINGLLQDVEEQQAAGAAKQSNGDDVITRSILPAR